MDPAPYPGINPAATINGRRLGSYACLQLKHWRRGTNVFRELHKLRASPDLAARIAANKWRWWHNSRLDMRRFLTIAYFDSVGVPRLS